MNFKLVRVVLGRLILGLAGILVIFVLLELGLRLWGGELATRSGLPVGWLLDDTTEWLPDKDLIFVRQDVKDNILSVSQNPPEKPLILVLGDSFVQGNTVKPANRFDSQMSLILQQRGLDHSLLNVGTSGYGVDQELTLLKQILAKGITPQILIWTFYVNDVFENGQQPTFTIDAAGNLEPLAGSKDFVYQRQSFYESIPLPAQLKNQSALVMASLHFFNLGILQQVPAELRTYHKKTPWAYQKMELEIRAGYELAKQYNFQIVPVLIEPQLDYSTDQPVQETQNEVGYINSFLSQKPNYIRLNLRHMRSLPAYQPIFNQIDASDPAVFFNTPSLDPVPYGYRHFNELGYKIFGQIVAEFVGPLLSQKP